MAKERHPTYREQAHKFITSPETNWEDYQDADRPDVRILEITASSGREAQFKMATYENTNPRFAHELERLFIVNNVQPPPVIEQKELPGKLPHLWVDVFVVIRSDALERLKAILIHKDRGLPGI